MAHITTSPIPKLHQAPQSPLGWEAAKRMKKLLAILPFAMLSLLAHAQFISGVTFTTTATSVTIMWSSAAPSAAYVRFGTTKMYGSRTPGLTSIGTSASLTIDNLQTGILYYFKIVARDSLKQPANSVEYTATPITQAHNVSLTWNANPPAQNVVGYSIYRSPTPGVGYELINSMILCDPGETLCAYDDQSVQAGSNNCYVATATDDIGRESGYSGEVCVEVPV